MSTGTWSTKIPRTQMNLQSLLRYPAGGPRSRVHFSPRKWRTFLASRTFPPSLSKLKGNTSKMPTPCLLFSSLSFSFPFLINFWECFKLKIPRMRLLCNPVRPSHPATHEEVTPLGGSRSQYPSLRIPFGSHVTGYQQCTK